MNSSVEHQSTDPDRVEMAEDPEVVERVPAGTLGEISSAAMRRWVQAGRFLEQSILRISPVALVLIGLFLSYLLFFVRPVFLAAVAMKFPVYIPKGLVSGADLHVIYERTQAWFSAHKSPYMGFYPPLATLFFLPILMVDATTAYGILTIVNVLLFALVTLVLPVRISEHKNISSMILLVAGTGLFSYGFQYELERGQFNIIAMSFCLAAIWIYHYHAKYRLLSYVLFTVSVQLKLFPLIFIVMFIDNWRDWAVNIRRMFALAAANVALLFALGPAAFMGFTQSIGKQLTNPLVWIGNHSIYSFVRIVAAAAAKRGWTWISDVAGWIQLGVLAVIGICILLIIWKAYQQRQRGLNRYLLLACTLGALVIPSASHDYTLSILPAPLAVLLDLEAFSGSAIPEKPRLRLIFLIFTLVLAAAYGVTLFSYIVKPPLLQNDFPPLMLMLLAVTGLSLLVQANRGQQFEDSQVVGIRP